VPAFVAEDGAATAASMLKTLLPVSVLEPTRALAPTRALIVVPLRRGSLIVANPLGSTEYVPAPLALAGAAVPVSCWPE